MLAPSNEKFPLLSHRDLKAHNIKMTTKVEPLRGSWKLRIKRFFADYKRRLQLREDTMNQDCERFLMELEDRNTWISYELNNLNSVRLRKENNVANIVRTEKMKMQAAENIITQENGLCYFRGLLVGNKRPQNSAAKHLDLQGHLAPINSCKLSRCMQYVLSCSNDKSVRLWMVSTGQMITVYYGHLKQVNDCDFHPGFRINEEVANIITCSGDGTIRFWNSVDSSSLATLWGHTEAVYKVGFSPNGKSIVSCSEDLSIRTWSFPEGFLLYIFLEHAAPVSTVNFSPSGR